MMPSSLNTSIPTAMPKANIPNAKAAPHNMPAIKETAQKFESVYLNEMLGHMFNGIPTTGMMGGGNSEAIFRSMMVQQYADGISKTGSLGISNAIAQEMIKMQEKAQ